MAQGKVRCLKILAAKDDEDVLPLMRIKPGQRGGRRVTAADGEADFFYRIRGVG